MTIDNFTYALNLSNNIKIILHAGHRSVVHFPEVKHLPILGVQINSVRYLC